MLDRHPVVNETCPKANAGEMKRLAIVLLITAGARILADTDTLMAFGLDHLVSEQTAAPEEIGAIRVVLLNRRDQAASSGCPPKNSAQETSFSSTPRISLRFSAARTAWKISGAILL